MTIETLETMIQSDLDWLEQEGIVKVVYKYTPDELGARWRILYGGEYTHDLTVDCTEVSLSHLVGIRDGYMIARERVNI